MRKMKMLVAILVMLLMLTNGNTNIVKADGDNYTYCEVTENEVTKKVWLKNGEVIDGNPGTMEQMSNVTIEVTPDDNCKAYLATFDEPTVRVTVNPGVEVTFGTEGNGKKASIQWLTCDNATVTVYAKSGEFAQNGSLPGSVYGVTTYNSNITFTGNIQYLCLGSEYTYSENENPVNEGTVTVNGHVYTLEWYKTTEIQSGAKYKGFKGSASVSGTVGEFTLREILYSNTLESELKADTGKGFGIEKFSMVNGTLTESTSNNVIENIPDVEHFYFELTPQGNNEWFSFPRYLSGAETGASGKVITETEAKELMEDGTARVGIYSSGVSVDLRAYNLAELKFERGTASAGSVTKPDGTGLLQITSYGKETIGVDVTGDVDRFSISFTRYNPNMDINVGGKITEGHIYKGSLQSDFPIDLGTFSCEGMWIMKDGIWNPSLFLSLGKAEYHPVDDVTLDQVLSLTKEYTDQVTGHVLSEMADMVVTEMASGVLNGLTSNETFQTAVSGYKDATVLTGVEIELSKFKYNETTGVVTDKQAVTEIEGNDGLDFTVKIPGGHKEGKKYIIVREHEEGNTKTMDVLEPTQNGDKLTFKTNKFSSFTIVETEADEIQETEGIGAVKQASLELTDSIAIIYEGAVLKSALGTGEAPVARFTYRNETTTVSGTQLADVDRNGNTYAVFRFECRDILPQFADENVKFELLLNDEVIACLEEYSVKTYCTSMLEKADSLGLTETKAERFKALLVDMLYYADAVKSHQNMSQTLTNSLTAEQQSYHTSGAVNNAQDVLSLTGEKDDPYCFTGATLVLRDKVNIQLSFKAESTDNLSLKIEFGGSTTEYTAEDFSYADGIYTFEFDEISATQYDTPLTASFYKDGVQQAQVLTYSVGTYVARSLPNASDDVKSVITEMYEFGQAAKNYVSAQ